jgi:hypothetical protein
MLFVIRALHLLIILFIILSPFIDNKQIKTYVLVFLSYLIFQYITGYRKCGLTELEYKIMGKEYKNGFLYRLINPMINIPEFYLDEIVQGVHIILIFVLYYQLYI